ncbi:cell division cycle protein 23-like protein [Platysternon megacephalum]|uniref:Cell division cycle protein 23-like protein n=1 Tax=Platysternon megacephalum TaxID=55544 RepID=A0A4D9E491_9SAUR|nr:cell division cycle protein 23-like protein [Platysternon megacephalum]
MRPHRSQEGADSMPARDRCPGPEGGASQPRPPEHGPQAPGAHDRMEQTAGGPASPPTRTLCQRPRNRFCGQLGDPCAANPAPLSPDSCHSRGEQGFGLFRDELSEKLALAGGWTPGRATGGATLSVDSNE